MLKEIKSFKFDGDYYDYEVIVWENDNEQDEEHQISICCNDGEFEFEFDSIETAKDAAESLQKAFEFIEKRKDKTK